MSDNTMEQTEPKEQTDTPPADLDNLRANINHVDAELVQLLNRRAQLSLAVGGVKRGSPGSEVFCPGREARLLHTLAAKNTGPLPDEHLLAIYRQILSSSRRLQSPVNVAFLGPEGTFSHLAARAALGDLPSLEPKPDLPEVFRSVENGDCELGVVPLENSLQGSVGQSLDLFMRHKVLIKAESSFPIRHSLLSGETELGRVEKVYSHPQPLAQCALWLRTNLPHVPVFPLESTAAAAGKAFEEKGTAAIAHCDLAGSLGLHTLARNIEDHPGNRTRFVIIGRTPADRPGTDKSSLLFTVTDKVGSLYSVLQCFAEHDINMLKLESRPLPEENWKYAFFADLQCDIYDDSHAGLLKELDHRCLSLRVLGSYPSAF